MENRRDESDGRNRDLDGREMVGRDGGAILTKGKLKTRMRNQRRWFAGLLCTFPSTFEGAAIENGTR